MSTTNNAGYKVMLDSLSIFGRGKRDALRSCRTDRDCYAPPYEGCAEYGDGWAEGCREFDQQANGEL